MIIYPLSYRWFAHKVSISYVRLPAILAKTRVKVKRKKGRKASAVTL